MKGIRMNKEIPTLVMIDISKDLDGGDFWAVRCPNCGQVTHNFSNNIAEILFYQFRETGENDFEKLFCDYVSNSTDLAEEKYCQHCGQALKYKDQVNRSKPGERTGLMRLINADALMETIERNAYPIHYDSNSVSHGMSIEGLKQAVDEQPTAYNVDNVVQDVYEFFAYEENPLGTPESFDKLMRIIKEGGAEWRKLEN